MDEETITTLRYRTSNSKYRIYSNDVEELLADYVSSHRISIGFQNEIERFVWQFFNFVQTGRLEKGNKIKPPVENGEYVVSREVLDRYVRALVNSGYSSSSITKRLQVVEIVLRNFGMPESLIDVLKRPKREANIARRIEQEENTPSLSIEDAREFFKRLEMLFQLGELNETRYIKAVAFALLLFATGRRVSEVVQVRAWDIDFKTHTLRIPVSQTKEGKIQKITSGERIVFMTKETEAVLRFYLETNKKGIEGQNGYLFMTPGKRSLKDTFLHKIIKMSREFEEQEANLDFITSDRIHRFKLKYFRKLFIQLWEQRAEDMGLMNEKVLMVARKLTGHRPLNDVHRVNYGKITLPELWKYYHKIYYNLSVMTPRQKQMFGIVKNEKKDEKMERTSKSQNPVLFMQYPPSQNSIAIGLTGTGLPIQSQYPLN